MEDLTQLNPLKSGRKMNSEKQPLLGHSESDSDHRTIPRPDIRNSPESALVEVQSENDDGSKESLEKYNPANHRSLEHPTSNLDTLIHLLKGNIGTGILAMPNAFKNAGLYVGLFGTMLMGLICTHCMHTLVKCAHELCGRCQVPSLGFSEVCFVAFETGPVGLRRYSHTARSLVNMFLCITQIGFCCVYFLFVAVNLQKVIAQYFIELDTKLYLLMLLVPMIILNLVRNLKYLTPISLLAAVLTVVGLSITFFYILQDLPHTETVKGFSSWSQLPLYFGTAIYAFEGIGIVLPLENNMKTPQDFGGISGVLNTGMVIVACLYTSVGFFGYLKFGEEVSGTITVNLPLDKLLAQSVLLMMGIAIFFSYSLQFYVPVNIIGPWIRDRLTTERSKEMSDYVLRIALVVFTCFLAAIIPNLEAVISLVGSMSSSTLALIFPPLIEIVTFWPNGLGKHYWILWKDVGIMIFGILGFVFGTYTSLAQILNPQEV